MEREFTLQLSEKQIRVIQNALAYTADKKYQIFNDRPVNSFDQVAAEVNTQVENQ